MSLIRKHQKHLINILKTNRAAIDVKHQTPTFTLFLGAGASISSGIKSARQMIEEWRSIYVSIHGEHNLKTQHWYDKHNEYSELFESLYDQPSQRREYIESCVSNAQVSWGYIYLVNLLNHGFMNAVFTTNFDDLLNEACYLFSDDLRPIVSAHDSSIQSVRLTSPRPKIIKLHGDFLFDNIKNTVRELESLEDNTRAKFKQYASEFGMIFIGYSGNDRSVMDTLNTLLHSKQNFPHGVYWCVLKGTSDDAIPIAVQNLARFERFHLIEIDGFDEFFAELHMSLGYSLQDQVTSPSIALQKKLDKIIFKNHDDDELLDDDSDGAAIMREDNLKLSQHFYNLIHGNDLLISLNKKLQEIKGSSADDSCCDNSELGQILDQLKECLEFVIVDDNDNTYLPIAVPKTIKCYASYANKAYAEAINDGLAALKTSNASDVLNVVIKSIAQTGAYKYIPQVKAYISSDTKTRTHRDVSVIMNAIVELISCGMYISARQLLSSLVPHAKLLSQNDAQSMLSYIRLNQSLCLILDDDTDINPQFRAELNSELKTAIHASNKRLMFGFACILSNDEIATSALDLMTGDEILKPDLRLQPICKIASEVVMEHLEVLVQKHKKSSEPEDSDSESVSDSELHSLCDEKGVANSDIIHESCVDFPSVVECEGNSNVVDISHH